MNNMITEDEARTKLCIQQPDIGYRLCNGTLCMAWRWETVEQYQERYTAWEDAANIAGINPGPEPIHQGYCGLAGKP